MPETQPLSRHRTHTRPHVPRSPPPGHRVVAGVSKREREKRARAYTHAPAIGPPLSTFPLSPSILYTLENPEKWQRYRAGFSQSVQATSEGPLCPCCKASREAVGAWSDDKTKRSVVDVDGEDVGACLTCSFFYNSPEVVEAHKRAQRMAAKMYDPEFVAQESARLKAEAAAQGITPVDFIVKWL